jgi:hypothetical protein
MNGDRCDVCLEPMLPGQDCTETDIHSDCLGGGGLGAAWAEAEAALPEPGYIVLGGPHEDGGWGASAFLYSQFRTYRWGGVNGHAGATAESAVATLRALAAKLREVGR